MSKLYRRAAFGKLQFHEAWQAGPKVIEHWGVVGARGKTKVHPLAEGDDAAPVIERVLDRARRRGFEPIGPEAHAELVIEFPEPTDEVMERVDKTLGWTGLGHVEGRTRGGGPTRIVCLVVDLALARKVVAADLEGTAYSAARIL